LSIKEEREGRANIKILKLGTFHSKKVPVEATHPKKYGTVITLH